MTIRAAMIALVVAIAGMMLPAMAGKQTKCLSLKYPGTFISQNILTSLFYSRIMGSKLTLETLIRLFF